MSHDHHHHSNATKNITVAFLLNLFFAVIEVIGGLLTNSVAILSDAVHDFGDSLSLGVAWYLQKVSNKKGDNRFSYGYKRFSLLGSIFISVVLIVGSVFIIMESVKRFAEPQQAHAGGMIIMAIFGVIVNGAAVLKLRLGRSHNERAVMLHMMEDVLGWIAVLIGGAIMHFWDLPFIDPLLSAGISVWVLYNVYRNLTATITIMLQEVPKEIDLELLKKEIMTLEGVESLHDLHLWTLDGQEHIMSLHLVVKEGVTHESINTTKSLLKELAAKEGINHVTIEVELSNEASDCHYLNNPC